MSNLTFHNILKEKFRFEPTNSQVNGFKKIAHFLSNAPDNSLLLIKGMLEQENHFDRSSVGQLGRIRKICTDGSNWAGGQSAVCLCWQKCYDNPQENLFLQSWQWREVFSLL